jgi:hypothetical protein
VAVADWAFEREVRFGAGLHFSHTALFFIAVHAENTLGIGSVSQAFASRARSSEIGDASSACAAFFQIASSAFHIAGNSVCAVAKDLARVNFSAVDLCSTFLVIPIVAPLNESFLAGALGAAIRFVAFRARCGRLGKHQTLGLALSLRYR